jgi:DNA-directed RNA polymerase specialized sigma24 family protein
MSWREGLPDHLPIVETLINQLAVPSYLRDEAYSEGLVAITEAARIFDSTRGVNLEAWLWLKTRYLLIDWMRRSMKVPYDLLGDNELPAPQEPEHMAEVNIVSHQILLVVQTFSMVERVVLLAPASGYNATEINHTLRINGPEQGKIRQEARQKVYHALGLL